MVRSGCFRNAVLFSVVATIVAAAAPASADTRIMPDRQGLKGQSMVVWGNTSLANGTNVDFNCDNGTPVSSGPLSDQSYIFGNCTYNAAGVFHPSIKVGAETATATVTIGDAAVLSAFDARSYRINMAIDDGLRFMYFNQLNRAARFTTNMTSWRAAGSGFLNNDDNHQNSFTALTILAIQNHGHKITSPQTDIFQPVIQRGLNYLFDALIQRDLSPCAETAGNPCVNVAAPVNIGLSAPGDGLDGYATGIFAAAIAAATVEAPNKTVDAGIGSNNTNFVVGRKYSEVLQRVTNALVWGQSDSVPGRGGWYYNLQAGSASDGSTMGWALLGLIDAAAAGATVPNFVRTEVSGLLPRQLNSDGTFDYQVDNFDQAGGGNMAKVGIGLQALAFAGAAPNDARVTAAKKYLTDNWTNQVSGYDGFQCSVIAGSPSVHNKGCGYAMFNIFKGLKFYGVATLPGIGYNGVLGVPKDDWYADYIDNLLSNQHQPTNATRGEWGVYEDDTFANLGPNMGWSCCEYSKSGITAMAMLILAPVAFVPPDPTLFSTVGLSPQTATNPVGTTHTVEAFAQSANLQPVPGATVEFKVLSGPNAGKSGTDTTGQDGKAHFTYTGDKGAGTDTIQAFIGDLASNQVTKTWTTTEVLRCDADNDKDVDAADLLIIRLANGKKASSASDPRDGNGDGVINVSDYRYCSLRLTPK